MRLLLINLIAQPSYTGIVMHGTLPEWFAAQPCGPQLTAEYNKSGSKQYEKA